MDTTTNFRGRQKDDAYSFGLKSGLRDRERERERVIDSIPHQNKKESFPSHSVFLFLHMMVIHS